MILTRKILFFACLIASHTFCCFEVLNAVHFQNASTTSYFFAFKDTPNDALHVAFSRPFHVLYKQDSEVRRLDSTMHGQIHILKIYDCIASPSQNGLSVLFSLNSGEWIFVHLCDDKHFSWVNSLEQLHFATPTPFYFLAVEYQQGLLFSSQFELFSLNVYFEKFKKHKIEVFADSNGNTYCEKMRNFLTMASVLRLPNFYRDQLVVPIANSEDISLIKVKAVVKSGKSDAIDFVNFTYFPFGRYLTVEKFMEIATTKLVHDTSAKSALTAFSAPFLQFESLEEYVLKIERDISMRKKNKN